MNDKQRKAMFANMNKEKGVSVKSSSSDEKFNKRLSHKGEPNEINVRELQLFIENDGDLYRQQQEPIMKNLDRKRKNGTYSQKGAEVAYLDLVENGSRKYNKEYGSSSYTFSKADKVQVAKEMARENEREYEISRRDEPDYNPAKVKQLSNPPNR